VAGAASSAGEAADALTEEQAVARALEVPAVGHAVEARSDHARAEERAAAAFDNPELEFEHEQLFGDGAETEDAVALAKTFEISGGRHLRSRAAAHLRRAVDAESEAWLADVEVAVRRSFHQLLHAQQRQRALASWVTRLEGAVRDVAARSTAGDASEYDRLRFQRELARARAELAREESRRDRAWIELAGWIGADPAAELSWPRVQGELLPSTPLPEDALEARSIDRNPELAALAARAAAAEETARAAGRSWVPALTLSAGYKTAAAAGERAHGFVVGVAAPLPVLSQGRGEQAAAAAERAELAAERELAATRLAAELVGLAGEAERMRRLALEQRPAAAEEGPRLLAAAEAGYRGGEISAMELVDAYGSHLEGELQLLEIELAAREARIELDRILKRTDR
jgi:cobalt-zinc-cadmium efflux system outer membrane protein